MEVGGGFFGTYLFDGVQWSQEDLSQLPEVAEPWMLLSIHDSDLAFVQYEPAGPGAGVAYLGYTPRIYFQQEHASPPTNVALEAAGLASWWASRQPDTTPAVRDAKAVELAGYLAADVTPPERSSQEQEALDDAEVFVEVKAARFIAALGLPVPEDLSA